MLQVLVSLTIPALLWEETRRPLRFHVESKLRHDLRNMGMALLSAVTLAVTEKPLSKKATKIVEQKSVGLLSIISLPKAVKGLLAIALMDYTLYLWHVLNHKTSFLWRFHEVHHEDLDLTASTAIRFHFMEMGLSSLWRAAQILVIGVTSTQLKIWQQLTLLEIIFHHSNLRIPISLERILCNFIVTPRMHAIHHSIIKEETNSNWSSGLTLWDWLHGTLKLNVPQETIVIGVPAYGLKRDLKFSSLIKKPFMPQRKSWCPLSQRVARSSFIKEKDVE
ncbi:MAG: sterol desaturase family protein [Bacteriovoracia bacterium]